MGWQAIAHSQQIKSYADDLEHSLLLIGSPYISAGYKAEDAEVRRSQPSVPATG